MSGDSQPNVSAIVWAQGEEPRFNAGDHVLVLSLAPIGHYRVPLYVRGKHGTVGKVIRPRFVNNESEGFGRNAGRRGYYYRIEIPLFELWSDYSGPKTDALCIEVFETWLQGAANECK